MFKKVMRRVALVMVLGCLLGVPALAACAATVEAAAPAAGQVQAAPAAELDMAGGKHLMEWGVMLFAVGEFAGMLGAGVCSIRRERRRERAARRPVVQSQPLLLYSEYKAATAGEALPQGPRAGFGLSALGRSAA